MSPSFVRGAKKALPVCLGIIPVGISYGMLAVQAGLSLFQPVLMSVTVMAGSSQLMAVGMLGSTASAAGSRRILCLVLLAAALNTGLRLILPVSWSVIISMIAAAAIGTFIPEANDEQK